MRCPACDQRFDPTVRCAHCRHRFTASTWWQEAVAMAGGLLLFATASWLAIWLLHLAGWI